MTADDLASAKPRAGLPTTQWSLIARLKNGDEQGKRTALEDLCKSYHYPLYCQIRRHGLTHQDAEDVLQGFFLKLLRLDTFSMIDPDRGRLRMLLLVALKRYLANWHRDTRSQKLNEVSIESMPSMADVRNRYHLDDQAHYESPDLLYDKQWAKELMGLVMQRLRTRYASKGRSQLFERLRPVLISGGSLTGHDSMQIATDLGMNPGALRMSLNRLLKDYRELLRDEILRTVEDHETAKGEYEQLMSIFSRL